MAVLRRLESKTQKRLQFVRERQLCIQVDALPLQINPLHSNSSYLLTYQHPQLADRTPLLASTLCACKQNLPTCGLRGPEPLNSSPPLTAVESYKSIEYFRVKRKIKQAGCLSQYSMKTQCLYSHKIPPIPAEHDT